MDCTGVEYPSLEEAKREAIQFLTELARDDSWTVDEVARWTCRVRAESGPIFDAN